MSFYRDKYLKSDHWQNLRLTRLVKSKARCTLCPRESSSNDVHHIRYRPSLFDVTEKDLRVLCRACHTEVHRLLDEHKKVFRGVDPKIKWHAIFWSIKRVWRDDAFERQFIASEIFPHFRSAAGNNHYFNALINLLRAERREEMRSHERAAQWRMEMASCKHVRRICLRIMPDNSIGLQKQCIKCRKPDADMQRHRPLRWFPLQCFPLWKSFGEELKTRLLQSRETKGAL